MDFVTCLALDSLGYLYIHFVNSICVLAKANWATKNLVFLNWFGHLKFYYFTLDCPLRVHNTRHLMMDECVWLARGKSPECRGISENVWQGIEVSISIAFIRTSSIAESYCICQNTAITVDSTRSGPSSPTWPNQSHIAANLSNPCAHTTQVREKKKNHSRYGWS